MRLLKEYESFSLSIAIQNSTLIIPYSSKLVQVFYGVRVYEKVVGRQAKRWYPHL
jgi:hypothetical protein